MIATVQTPSTHLRVLIVDDEPLARRNLILLLRRQADIDWIGECGSGAEALIAIPQHRPDVVFLDVQMPECDGFDVIEQMGNALPSAIVFVTAYDQYAIRAFEVGALDYLLKPFDDARFARALARARERLHQPGPSRKHLQRIVVKNAGQVLFLNCADIDWIGADDYYASVHIGPQTHLLRRSLADLERELDPARFCRIHRSTIINCERLQSILSGPDGEPEAQLAHGVRLRISRRYRRALQERLHP